MALNPHTATREQFTTDLANRPVPVDATEEWRKYAEALQPLLRKLAFHDAMQANLHQTYMTPAESKNKVYFMWDFVGRTLGTLYSIPSTVTFKTDNEACADVITRSTMAAQLILDEMPGMLDMMVSSTYPGQPGPSPQFDAETIELARKLKS